MSLSASAAGPDSLKVTKQDTIKTVNLDELVVTASNVTHNALGYRINMANQKIAKGKNSIELLQFIPNVTSIDKRILINGKPAGQITIDGRKVYDMTELENIPGEYIESINVQYISGAGYLSENRGGIIAIKLKKAPENGLFGSLSGSGLVLRKAGAESAGLNGAVRARIGKLSIYEAPYYRWFNFSEWTRECFSYETEKEVTNTRQKDKGMRFQNNFSINYEFNKNHNIGFYWFSDFLNKRTRFNDTDTHQLTLLPKTKQFKNVFSVNYTGTLNDNGDRLVMSAEMMNRNFDLNQHFFPASPEEQTVGSYTGRRRSQMANLWQLKADYFHKFNDNINMNIGGVYKTTNLHNNTEDFNSLINCIAVDRQRIVSRTPMPYASLSGSFGKIRYYAGLNWQLNYLKVDNEKSFTQNAVNPSVQLSMPFGQRGNHTLDLNYSHSLDNVPYDAVSEKKVWTSPFAYYTGNRSLKASTENNIAVGLSLLNSKFTFRFSYTHSNNIIQWENNFEEGSNIVYSKPINGGTENNYFFNAYYNPTFFGVWTMKIGGYLAWTKENSIIAGTGYYGTRFRQYYSCSNSLNFKNGWGASLFADYEPSLSYYDRKLHTVYRIECGAYKKLFNDDLQIRISFTPLRQRRKVTQLTGDRKYSLKSTSPVEDFNLGVTWFFRSGKKDIKVNVKGTSLRYDESVHAM